jgi:serine/threonine protein kinase
MTSPRSDADPDPVGPAGQPPGGSVRPPSGVGAPPAADDGALRPGDVIHGTYRVERLLGVGGFAHVYLASNVRIPGLRFAVKVLRRECCQSPELVARFEREAAMAAQLRHPRIVDVLDFAATAEGQPFIVMQYVDGVELDELVRRHTRLRPSDTVRLTLDILEALEVAHEHGVVHRDLKPSNIMVVREAGSKHLRAKVLDFGIAKVFEPAGQVPVSQVPSTQAGHYVCTPEYAAPEVFAGHPVPSSDLYSLGLVMMFMLDGQSPNASLSLADVIASVFDPTPVEVGPYARRSGLGEVLLHAVAKPVSARYASAREMRKALESRFDPHALSLEVEVPLLLEGPRVTGSLRAVSASPSGLPVVEAAPEGLGPPTGEPAPSALRVMGPLRLAAMPGGIIPTSDDELGTHRQRAAVRVVQRASPSSAAARRRSPLLATAITVAVAGAGVGAWLLLREPPPAPAEVAPAVGAQGGSADAGEPAAPGVPILPESCGSGEVEAISIGASREFTLCGAGDEHNPVEGNGDCKVSGSRGEDRVFRLDITEPVARVRVDLRDVDEAAPIDTLLYVRRVCDRAASQVACNDSVRCADSDLQQDCRDPGAPQLRHSRLDATLDQGSWYIVADQYNYSAYGCGRVRLSVERLPGGGR